MTHTLIVEVPDPVYRRLKQAANAAGKSIQEVAADNLAGEPLALEPDLPEPYRSELIGMAVWSEEALRRAMVEVMAPTQQRRYQVLLRRLRTRELTGREAADLDALRDEADRLMLRKARAAALLRSHGHRVPGPEALPSPQ